MIDSFPTSFLSLRFNPKSQSPETQDKPQGYPQDSYQTRA